MTYILRVTTKDIYGVATPAIPNGYRIVDFRPPQFHELFLTNPGSHLPINVAQFNYNRCEPRLILVEGDSLVAHTAKSRRVVKVVDLPDGFYSGRLDFGLCEFVGQFLLITYGDNRFIIRLSPLNIWCASSPNCIAVIRDSERLYIDEVAE